MWNITATPAFTSASEGAGAAPERLQQVQLQAALDCVGLWLSAWCACLFVGPQSCCLFYDDSPRHTRAIYAGLGVGTVHVASGRGHLITSEVALLQLHHASVFLSAMLLVSTGAFGPQP